MKKFVALKRRGQRSVVESMGISKIPGFPENVISHGQFDDNDEAEEKAMSLAHAYGQSFVDDEGNVYIKK